MENTLKRLLSFAMALLLVLSLVPFNGLQVYATETDADLTISTVEGLQVFAAEVNGGNSYEGKTVVLTNDIDLNYTAVVIGTKANPFKGTFDGQEHTVKNLTIYENGSDSDYFADTDNCVGLFGVINTPAVIKNVTVDNPYIVGSSYVGAIVGMAYTGKIENCHVTGEIDIEGYYMVGGITGHGYAKIYGCSVIGEEDWEYSYVGASYKESNLEGDNVGGIVGHAAENNNIEGCTVKNVTVSGTRKVGGIVGITAQNSDITGCSVENVTVETTATAEYAADNAKTMSIGGIVGQYMADSNGTGGTLSDCTVSGLTFANENNVTVNAGALTGGVRASSGTTTEPTEGNITVSGNTASAVEGDNVTYLEPEAPVYAVMIGEQGYATLADALTAAQAMTGDVTVEVYDKVTLNSNLSGSFDSITFVGKDTDAEIYLEVQGYITATGKKVAFEALTLSKSEGVFITNAGFMNVAFGVYDVTEVTYTDCTFANGAYASSGKVTYTDCTFKKSHEKYGLWAYGDVDVTVNKCVFDNDRGIKMYAEGAAKTVDLTVKNTDFSKLTGKPAIVLTYGESVTLEGNTYSSTGAFELDLDGAPNGTAVTADAEELAKITCKNDNGACGVLVDGKIYTTVAQAAAVATEGSTVTLLHDSTETVELPEGVTLDKNGHTADGVSVAVSAVAQIGTVNYETLQAAIDAAQARDTIVLLADVALTQTLRVEADDKITLDLNGYVIDGQGQVRIAVMTYGDLTVKDSSDAKTGAIKAGIGTAGNTVNVCGGTFTLESGSIYSLNNALLIDEEAATVNIKGGSITAEPTTRNSAVMYVSSTAETVVNIEGGKLVGYNGILLWNNTEINMTGGSIEAKGSVGIQGNGSKDNTEINISGDAAISGYYAAIYHPQGGELNISGNAALTGWTGVVVKGGEVNISGGTISGTGAADTYRPVSSGFVDTGDALYIEHYDNSANSENYGTPVVTVTGGTFTSANAKAVASYVNTNNDIEALTGIVSGGTFNTAVSEELCAEGYTLVDNGDGTYGVKVTLPEVQITDIKDTLTGEDPDLTFALNFAIPNVEDLTEEYLNELFEVYGDYYVDYVLTINGLNGDSVTFNANGNADGYLAGQYDAYGEDWLAVPFSDVVVNDGESLYIMEYAAKLMNKQGLRFTLAEVAAIVQNFDCGVYFTPEFLAEHPDLDVSLQLKVFTEDAEGNKIENIDVATNEFENNYAAAVSGEGKQTVYYATFAEAYAAAQAGDTVELLKDAKLTGKLTINKGITIDGNGCSIIADVENAVWYTVSGTLNIKNYKTHLLGINSDNVTLKDIVLDCNNNAAGINVYCAQNVVFDNVQIINATKGVAGLTVNGSTLTAKNALTITGNAIAIDISNGSGVTSDLGMTIEDGTVTDLGNKTVKFASVANNDMTGAVDANGEPYFAAVDNAYYYTQSQIASRTTGYTNGLTLLDDVTLSKDVTISGTLDLNGNDLTVADGNALKVSGNLTITGEGSVDGTIKLTKTTATLTTPAGMENVESGVEGYKVVYSGGVCMLILENTVAWNAATGVEYETVQAALLAAKSGETVQLLADTDESGTVLTVLNGITLDLNGHTLTAYYAMTATTGSYIINSTNGDGLLKVAKDNLVMADNTQIMVWKEEDSGYRFASVTFGTQVKVTGTGSARFNFYVKELDGIVLEELADGTADNDGLSIQVKMTYTNSQNTVSTMYFEFPMSEVQKYAANLPGYLYMGIGGLDAVTDVTFTAVVKSGSVLIESAAVSYEG